MLQETKCNGEDLARMAKSCWKGCEAVAIDSSGAAGGLGLLWNPKEVALSDFRASRFDLTASFHIMGIGIKGTVSNIYGPSSGALKDTFLDMLRWMGEKIGLSHWVAGADFNLIRSLEEKRGGICQLNSHSRLFGDIIETLHLVDIRASNGIFTWNNKWTRDRSIEAHLDRFLISKSLILGGGDISGLILPSAGSDH